MRFVLIFLLSCGIHQLYSQTSTTPEPVKAKVEYRNSNAVFNLYPTENYFTFIKLDTRNGKMWQVQYNTDSEKRFTSTLNDIELVFKSEESNQRFMLIPTINMFTFILMDQIDGQTWQVQWNSDPLKRMVVPIR
jgi:hypothetical protein